MSLMYKYGTIFVSFFNLMPKLKKNLKDILYTSTLSVFANYYETSKHRNKTIYYIAGIFKALKMNLR